MKKPEDEYSMSKKGTALEEGEALVKNNCRSTVIGSYTACRVQRYIDESYVELELPTQGC